MKASEALRDAANELDKPGKIWWGDSGATVKTAGPPMKFVPIAEWLRDRAESLNATSLTRGEDAVERVAEAMWLHRPMERAAMGAPKPWADLKPYQHQRYREWALAAIAALEGS